MAQIRLSRVVPASRAKAFALLTNSQQLPELLEPKVQVEVLSEPLAPKKGAEYAFKMSRFGLVQPVRWRVEQIESNKLLTYRQTEGLFKKWLHTQLFEDHGEKECLVTDIVEYELPMGLFGHLLDDLMLRQDMKQILSHRLQKAVNHFVAPENS
jgi:ligand-binding SRPBCC domain-containing protein